jgi:hypothetical protein
MRRTILLTVLILMGCHGTSYYQKQVASTCPGTPGGDPPLVCVDPITLQPTPEPVHVSRGHWVHFFLNSGSDDLEIDSDVLENKGHDHGHAWGRAKQDATLGGHKYSIVDVTTGKRNDPTIMIDP